MDNKHKILLLIGTSAVMATAGIGGYALHTRQDPAPEIAQVSDIGTAPAVKQPVAVKTDNKGSTTITPRADLETKSETPSNTSTPAPAQAPTPAPAHTTPTYTYKNGTYSATVSYSNDHGGTNSITTTINVANDIISAVSDTHAVGDSHSQYFVDKFESGVSSVAAGQPLATISPSRIGGASLTTDAFKSAVAIIRVKAKA